MLAGLARPTAVLLLVYAGARVVDVVVRGHAAAILDFGDLGGLFIAEIVLAVLPAIGLLNTRRLADHGHLFRMALLVILAATLYRFTAFLVAYRPGPGWAYFPTVPEILITLGFVALEITVFILLVKRFPILGGITPKQARAGSSS
jgi:Ni/Fe-hydrogenase subunit HybB-like protein